MPSRRYVFDVKFVGFQTLTVDVPEGSDPDHLMDLTTELFMTNPIMDLRFKSTETTLLSVDGKEALL